jgi:repressor of nif and glnA expression
MRELNPNEILAIAGGLPPVAALDEAFYRNPAEPLRDPVEFAELRSEELAARTPD